MSAADAREELEAAIWRLADPAATPAMMAVALRAADRYADAAVSAALDDRARNRRLAAAEASAAEHRERLAQATAKRTRRPA